MQVFTPCQLGNCGGAKPTILNLGQTPTIKRVGAMALQGINLGVGNAFNYVPKDSDWTMDSDEDSYKTIQSSRIMEETESESESVPENDYCCGEGYLYLEDEEGSQFRFRLVSEPNPKTLTNSIEKMLDKIRSWFRRQYPVTPKDVTKLNILCTNSALTLLGAQQGLFIGTSGVLPLTNVFNALKISPYLNVQVSSRLVCGDVLLLNIMLGVTNQPGTPCQSNPIIDVVTLSGQFHIISCGEQLCVDHLTVHSNSLRTV